MSQHSAEPARPAGLPVSSFLSSSSSSPKALLSCRDLCVRYAADGPLVLDHVSLTLEAGHFYLLSGPSGGGKSTLLAALNGTLAVNDGGLLSGEIVINGEAASPEAALRAKHVGSVLQDPNNQIVFAEVEDELAFPLENLSLPRGDMRQRVPAAAAAMKLRLAAPTDKLSGGQKQRLITAATLGMGQKILLFDEPLASLDEPGARLLLTHLSRLAKEEDCAVLFIEHRIDWVLPYADRFLWMENAGLQTFPDSGAFEAFFDENIRQKLGAPLALPPASASSDSPLIRMEHVTCRAGDHTILEDVNFSLFPGDRYVIRGENGAGKTTFLHLLSGLLKPTRGRVVYGFPKRERFRKIGLVMQNPSYQLFLPTVEQELNFQAADPKVVARLIDIFNFGPLLERHPHSLSEGQKRRLGFAAILSMLPEILFLDEPTVGQDYLSLSGMLEALSEIYRERPLTLLTLTHDTRCGAFFGDRILEIKDRTIHFEAP